MDTRIFFAASLALALAACSGGGGGGSTTPLPVATATPATPNSSSMALETISFSIPASSSGVSKPASAVRQKTSLSFRKPLYVSPDTAAFTLSVDGNLVFNGVSATTPASRGTTNIPNETGTASYSVSNTTNTAPQGTNGTGSYYTISMNVNAQPGTHTIGVVMTAADGFVLSERQKTLNLTAGINAPSTYYLHGVVDSAFWCDAACDGGTGQESSAGVYTLDVFATDHEGDAIAYQQNSGDIAAFDNGPVTAVETDNNNIVTIGNGGPFANPGNAFTVDYQEGGQAVQEGWPITLQCQNVGSTTVALEVGPQAAGPVSGFNYSAQINTSADPVNPNAPVYNPYPTPQTGVYTTPNQLVGTVPVAQDFGNELNIVCPPGLGLIIL
jgi:hypothetical protein